MISDSKTWTFATRRTFEDAANDSRIKYYEVYARGEDDGDYTKAADDEYSIVVMGVDTPKINLLEDILANDLVEWQFAVKSIKPFHIVQVVECDRSWAESYSWTSGREYPIFGTETPSNAGMVGGLFTEMRMY